MIFSVKAPHTLSHLVTIFINVAWQDQLIQVHLLGASRGIGLEVARGLAEAGANIAIVYRSSQKAGEDAAREIQESYGVKALAYQAEVGDAAAIDSVVGRVTKEFGGLDIAVINAGVSECFDALGCEPDKYREQMAVNLDGAFYSAQAAAKVFQSQGKGNIIFTTSISAVIVNTPQNQSIVCHLKQSFYPGLPVLYHYLHDMRAWPLANG